MAEDNSGSILAIGDAFGSFMSGWKVEPVGSTMVSVYSSGCFRSTMLVQLRSLSQTLYSERNFLMHMLTQAVELNAVLRTPEVLLATCC